MNKKALLIFNLILGILTLWMVVLSLYSYSKDKNSDHLVDLLIWVPVAAAIIISTTHYENKKNKSSNIK
jgi:cellobiose-specific phosphotransferase system component IIC